MLSFKYILRILRYIISLKIDFINFISFLNCFIGGSQTFEEKQKFFYSMIEKMHPYSSLLTVTLELKRESLLLDVS